MRGLAESTDFEDGAFDLVVFSFVIHECPQVIDYLIITSSLPHHYLIISLHLWQGSSSLCLTSAPSTFMKWIIG
jgi:hypothetical protein